LIQLLESGPASQALQAVDVFIREIRQALDAM
jgi:hypothetical protein